MVLGEVLVQSNVAEDIHLAVVIPPGRIAMQHPVLMPQHHIPNQTLRFGDGWVAQDLVCCEDLHGLCLRFSHNQGHLRM